jgi:hypothetical protein
VRNLGSTLIEGSTAMLEGVYDDGGVHTEDLRWSTVRIEKFVVRTKAVHSEG